ncbi:MAG: hypothetical protein H0W65_07535 [Sphingomonas sp.]|uniref:hypothetical protein n=1 Tax=Sphingomonas sp. TaxID=28214 RepID=UPI0017ACF748|nr:hypothetical protein [Sphingomonas sp.]MBA3667557.1 hypothetical protein [Sphingomonas sp.]
MGRSGLLVVGGGLSLAAAALHLACIAGGPAWYRFFGAGEGMARLAERGDWRPAAIAAAIAAMLALAAAYAFSGAGLIARLPLLRTGLVVISAIYLLRGLVVLMPSALGRADLSRGFLLWSSLIVLAFGIVHAVGTARIWKSL